MLQRCQHQCPHLCQVTLFHSRRHRRGHHIAIKFAVATVPWVSELICVGVLLVELWINKDIYKYKNVQTFRNFPNGATDTEMSSKVAGKSKNC